jgi:hypothetical protein
MLVRLTQQIPACLDDDIETSTLLLSIYIARYKYAPALFLNQDVILFRRRL